MANHDPRIDAYNAKSADFAQPLLERLRAIVHEACPDVEETLKWSMPSFVHAGGILCMMAAFKQHVSFRFWNDALVMGEGAEGEGTLREGMGSFGKLREPADLPSKKQLLAWIRKAMALNEQGVKASGTRKAGKPKPPPAVPDDLAKALAKNRKAKATFDGFPPGQKREYVDWITEAKRDETRLRRLQQAVEWMAEGKRRNWKYSDC